MRMVHALTAPIWAAANIKPQMMDSSHEAALQLEAVSLQVLMQPATPRPSACPGINVLLSWNYSAPLQGWVSMYIFAVIGNISSLVRRQFWDHTNAAQTLQQTARPYKHQAMVL